MVPKTLQIHIRTRAVCPGSTLRYLIIFWRGKNEFVNFSVNHLLEQLMLLGQSRFQLYPTPRYSITLAVLWSVPNKVPVLPGPPRQFI